MLGQQHRTAAAAGAALLIAAGASGIAAASERSFSLTIAGAAGARYSGQCTLTTAGGDEIIELAGVVPRHEELSAEAVACRFASAGRITIELTHERGRSRATINGGSAHLAVR